MGNNSTTPVDVPGLSSGVTALAVGEYHTCALNATGRVMCWGKNDFGQLGDGTTTSRATPVEVSGLSSGVTAIAAGYDHTCAVTAAGGVKCWGYNFYGQLGDGTTTNRLVPVDVSGLSSGITAIAAGSTHTCAMTAAGGVKCWGYDFAGALGDDTPASRLTPVDVSGLSSGVAAIAAGGVHTCALTAAGGVKCWGDNGAGQLGDGTHDGPPDAGGRLGLSSGVAAIAAGGGPHLCPDCRGRGQVLGIQLPLASWATAPRTNRLTPVDVSGLSSGVDGHRRGRVSHLRPDHGGRGQVLGMEDSGQLGDGTTTDQPDAGGRLGLRSGVAAISAGWEPHLRPDQPRAGSSAGGITTLGQLGDGTTTNRAHAGGRRRALQRGRRPSRPERPHLRPDRGGGVKCWGYNWPAGDGTQKNRLTPVDVLGLSSGVAAIAAGGVHTCALTRLGGSSAGA